tara:strand:+ start:286 stop:591 length:306 start_codon:yes stop_codon:yes gene_type:complete
MRSILIIGLTSFGLLGACAEKQLVESGISARPSRAAVLDGYKRECISEYGFNKEGSDLLASCVQSKDQYSNSQAGKKYKLTKDTFERFNETFNKGSYIFKS